MEAPFPCNKMHRPSMFRIMNSDSCYYTCVTTTQNKILITVVSLERPLMPTLLEEIHDPGSHPLSPPK